MQIRVVFGFRSRVLMLVGTLLSLVATSVMAQEAPHDLLRGRAGTRQHRRAQRDLVPIRCEVRRFGARDFDDAPVNGSIYPLSGEHSRVSAKIARVPAEELLRVVEGLNEIVG
jgi:hypothetical protein